MFLVVLTKTAEEIRTVYCGFEAGAYRVGPDLDQLKAVSPSDVVDRLLAPLAGGNPPGRRPGLLVSSVRQGHQNVLLVAERREEGWFDLTTPFDEEPCEWVDIRDAVIDLLGRFALGTASVECEGARS